LQLTNNRFSSDDPYQNESAFPQNKYKKLLDDENATIYEDQKAQQLQ
jgi:hypothetical protein